MVRTWQWGSERCPPLAVSKAAAKLSSGQDCSLLLALQGFHANALNYQVSFSTPLDEHLYYLHLALTTGASYLCCSNLL